MRCLSPFCTVIDGVRGIEFTPGEGLSEKWCPECVRISKEIQFFSIQTINMIREIYQSYINTNLPKQVKLFLKQYTREIIEKLGGEI